MNPFIILIIGMAVVLVGLACIIGIVKLMSFICAVFFGKRAKRSSAELAQVPVREYDSRFNQVDSPAAKQPLTLVKDRRQLIAAISAAIAAESGMTADRIRICSIRRLDGCAASSVPIKNRREFVAAVSAAIACESGMAAERMRICSIRRLDGGAAPLFQSGSRGEVVAAISAAVAEASGSECAALRLVSIKRI